MPPHVAHPRLPVRHRVAGHRRAVGRRPAARRARCRVASQRDARAVRFVSFDGAYSESLTLDQARRNDVLVAYELEGEPSSSDHGGPVRLYVAPMYGYKSMKWLGGIELTRRGRPRLLGAAGLRRRRVGRSVQRPRRRGDVTMSASAHDRPRGTRRRSADIVRFDRTERIVHWVTASLFVIAHAHRRGAVCRAGQHARRSTGPHARHPRHRRPRAPGAARDRRRRPRGAALRRDLRGSTAGSPRPRLVASADARHRAAREVQPGPEAQRDVPRRRRSCSARHRRRS